MEFAKVATKRRFQLVLVKPSHYDDDGYVIRWWRALIPSNSLAAVYGLALDARERQVLGPDVAIDIDAIDETNTRVNIPKLIARFRKHGNFGLFGARRRAVEPVSPRARHRAAVPRRRYSGRDGRLPCLRLPVDARRTTPSISTACRDLGISMFAGEAEGRLDGVLRDAADGTLKPLYNYMNDLPGIERHADAVPAAASSSSAPPAPTRASTPAAAARFNARSAPSSTCRAASRASASPDDIEQIVRDNWAQGIHKFFITDDNFARNKDWEAIFDRLIELREATRSRSA